MTRVMAVRKGGRVKGEEKGKGMDQVTRERGFLSLRGRKSRGRGMSQLMRDEADNERHGGKGKE